MILRIDPDKPDAALLERASRLLVEGKLVVAPTETRYGLLARADRQDVLENLYRVKNRQLSNPTALLVRDSREAASIAYFNARATLLAERFFPGPLTLVLNAREDWPPPRVVNGKLGLRCSPAPIIAGLLSRTDLLLSATSANLSGQNDLESVEEIVSELGDEVGLYLDAGRLSGKTSTVVDCSSESPRILRDGAIGRDEIEELIGGLSD